MLVRQAGLAEALFNCVPCWVGRELESAAASIIVIREMS